MAPVIFFFPFLFVCISMCVCEVCTYTMWVFLYRGEQKLMSADFLNQYYFLRQKSLTEPRNGYSGLNIMANECLNKPLSPPSLGLQKRVTGLVFPWVLGIWTQGLTLAYQIRHHLNYLLGPEYLFSMQLPPWLHPVRSAPNLKSRGILLSTLKGLPASLGQLLPCFSVLSWPIFKIKIQLMIRKIHDLKCDSTYDT